MTTVWSYVAPSSVRSVFQSATALSHSAPFGACGRPFRYSNVVSSGAIMPARAPASIDMLHTVIRSSMESARITEPVYSITWPVAPPTPSRVHTARITSFADTPGRSVPSTRTSNVFGRVCSRHCDASTCATCDVPIPNASAPNAPCVLVWLSPHTTVMPGCVSPSSGPITCTLPCRLSPRESRGMPHSSPLVARGEQRNAELLAVLRQLIELRLARRRALVEHGHRLEAARRRRRGVVHRRAGPLRAAHLQGAAARLGERLC